MVDDELGETVCGLGECLHAQDNCVKGQPVQCDPMRGATVEICDGLDNDCDGEVDEDGVCEVPMCPPGSTELCDDGDPCTYGDQCDGEGNCTGTRHSSCLPEGDQDLMVAEDSMELQMPETDAPGAEEVNPSAERVDPSGGCHHHDGSGPWWMIASVLFLLVALRVWRPRGRTGHRLGGRE